MSEAVSRRTLFALAVATLIGGCSQSIVSVPFRVAAEGISPLLDHINDFARRYGYMERGDVRANDVFEARVYNDEFAQYEGWRTFFYLSQWSEHAPEIFAATFRPKDDWWLIGLHADLFSIADEFKRVIGRVEGVRVEEGYH